MNKQFRNSSFLSFFSFLVFLFCQFWTKVFFVSFVLFISFGFFVFFSFFVSTSAFSAQIKEARADSELTFSISAYDLNRIKVVDDRVKNIKMNEGEFEVIDELDSGEVYIRPIRFISSSINPSLIEPRPINSGLSDTGLVNPGLSSSNSTQVIFLTTEKGYTYKLTLISERIPAEQLFIKNIEDKGIESKKWIESKRIEDEGVEGVIDQEKEIQEEEIKDRGKARKMSRKMFFSSDLKSFDQSKQSKRTKQGKRMKDLEELLRIFQKGKKPLGFEYNTMFSYLKLGPFKLNRTRCLEDSSSNLILERYVLKNPFNEKYELDEEELFFDGVQAISFEKKILKAKEKIVIDFVRENTARENIARENISRENFTKDIEGAGLR
jgi:hypothetical protein